MKKLIFPLVALFIASTAFADASNSNCKHSDKTSRAKSLAKVSDRAKSWLSGTATPSASDDKGQNK